MLLTVNHDADPSYQGSITLLTGYDEAGRARRFGADTRVASDILDVVTVEGEIIVEIENWQLWGRG